MHALDRYDAVVAFDDYFVGHADGDALGAASVIMHHAGRRRLRAPMTVMGVNYDPTPKTFDPPKVILGDLGDETAPEPTGLPLYDSLQTRFAEALPKPKMVRVDDQRSYEAFREERRAPYVDRLEARLEHLEEEMRAHLQDGHVGRLAALEAAFERHVSNPTAHSQAVVGALTEVAYGGTPIALPLPEAQNGSIACWRDRNEILCSIRLPDDDGVRIATTAVPIRRAVQETLGAAMSAGVAPDKILLVVPAVAQVLGGLALVPQMCRAADDLCAADKPWVGMLLSPTDPKLAAAMALVQRCQRGDPRACAEAGALRQNRKRLVKAAERLLTHGQRESARRS